MVWSSGMILTSDVRGREFDSRKTPNILFFPIWLGGMVWSELVLETVRTSWENKSGRTHTPPCVHSGSGIGWAQRARPNLQLYEFLCNSYY